MRKLNNGKINFFLGPEQVDDEEAKKPFSKGTLYSNTMHAKYNL